MTFPPKPPVFFWPIILIYKAEKKQGRVSMGNHREQTFRCPVFKDKKDSNAFQIFSKKSEKNLMISWLGVESNHRHTAFKPPLYLNPEELLSYHNQMSYKDKKSF